MMDIDQGDRQECPVCSSRELRVFLEVSALPAQDGVVYATREAALGAPVGDVKLAICRSCQFIGNLAYDASLINFSDYNYSQHHSRQFRDHIDRLVARLVGAYSIRSKTVVDVGCGNGYFLNEICKAGDNRGVGIDPSLHVSDDYPIDVSRVELIKEFYSSRFAGYAGALVSCRHVLEELESPLEFLQLISGSLADEGAILYLEVPDALRTFERNLIWNIGYAKRSWFTAGSLASLLRHCDLEVVETDIQFGGEYLGIIGRKAARPGPRDDAESPAAIIDLLDRFARHLEREVERWRERVSRLRERGEQMVIWGAGMRGINFLHRFGDPETFPKIVDINQDRQGGYLPGSGYRIEAPAVLRSFRPSRVLISNPGYKEEIRAELGRMGIDPVLESL